MATLGTFTAGQVLTAAELNAIGTFVSYTPTMSEWTVGNGSITGSYAKVNELVFVQVQFQAGSTTVFAGNPDFSLPVTGSGSDVWTQSCRLSPTGSGASPGLVYVDYTSNVRLFAIETSGTYTNDVEVSSTVPATWTQNGTFQCEFMYRAA